MNFLKLFLLSVLGLTAISAAYANTFVGTGGEGIFVGNKVYVRDLYEYDEHLNPWVGADIDPMLVRELGDWNPLGLNQDQLNLLLRKLNDANQASPRLGSYLIMALRYYDWRLTDLPIALPPDAESRFNIPEKDRAGIANRYMQSIAVQRMNFLSLDDENKVALLIHEAIYSLVKTSYQLPLLLTQSVATTRLLTANLFSSEKLSQRLREMAPLFLNVPDGAVNNMNMQICSLAMLGLAIYSPNDLNYGAAHLEEPFSSTERRAFLYRTYQNILDQGKGPIGLVMSTEMAPENIKINLFFPPSLVLRPAIYISENGQQIELKVEPVTGYNHDFMNTPGVLEQIMGSLDTYYDGLDCR